ncbi:MAG: polysaccharide biosynthesis C-terminal domain-containing protein [Candidatus Eremiobacteraeota bacterium]|nr:polysaccharide biosynthesis C-terminal domain-containing protein [Candidatus Eremiobacteraeota bacterium]
MTARILGPEGRGIYALPTIDAGLVSALFTGLTSSVSYFMLNKKVGRGAFAPAFLTAGIFVAMGSVGIVILATLANQRWAIAPAIASLPFIALMNISVGILTGVKMVRYNGVVGLLSTVGTFTLMIVGFSFFSRTPTIAIAAWLINLAVLAGCVITVALYNSRHLPLVALPFREYFRFAAKLGAVNLLTLLNYRIDVYIVAMLTSPATLGIYTLAVAAAESLQTVAQVATIITAPHIASLDRKAALALTSRCVRNNTAIAALLCVIVAFAAPFLIQAVYGTRFMAMIPSLRVLLIGVVGLSGASPLSSFFTLKVGRPEISMVMASISAAICLVVTILLLPRIGILGAAIGTAASYVFAQTASIWFFCRNTGVSYGTVLFITHDDLAFYRDVVLGGVRHVRAALSSALLRP